MGIIGDETQMRKRTEVHDKDGKGMARDENYIWINKTA
jgi:hypothetical protein